MSRQSANEFATVEVVNMVQRRRWPLAEKLRIVEETLLPGMSVSLVARKHGVAPTNNHAERILRFAVLWRKASFGTVSENGGRFAERILSLRQTCRLRGKRIFPVLVDAMTAFFAGTSPETAWIHEAKS